MEQWFSRLLEITFMAVALYLVLTNGDAFSNILGAGGKTYAASVKALQGR